MDGHTIAIIAALIGALGAIIAAVITAIAIIHSNKRNSNNPPPNTNAASPQKLTQSYTVGRTVTPQSKDKLSDFLYFIMKKNKYIDKHPDIIAAFMWLVFILLTGLSVWYLFF